MTHAVEDRGVGDPGIDGVVDGVARHMVGGLEHSGDGDGAGGDGQGWQQRPLDLRGEAHLPATAQPNESVAIQRFGRYQLGGHRRQLRKQCRQQSVFGFQGRAVGDRDSQHSEPIGAYQEGQPDTGAIKAGVLNVYVKHLERPSRQRRVNVEGSQLRLVSEMVRGDERHQQLLP